MNAPHYCFVVLLSLLISSFKVALYEVVDFGIDCTRSEFPWSECLCAVLRSLHGSDNLDFGILQ
jgi:hypothetical protein